MRITVLTLFPEFFASPLAAGLMGKAVEKGLVDFALVNPRDFASGRHRSVDDSPYGGGPGMVMFLQPLADALDALPEPSRKGRILLLSPGGRPFNQAMARELAREESVTLICGRYEGIDARIEELYPVEPVSVGDYVLNGGETAALAIIEAVARLTPEFMGKEASGEEESHTASLLEYPHYTRPEVFRGRSVPQALLSGDHARIARWRRERALETTLSVRPDLLDGAELTAADAAHLRGVSRNLPGRNLHLALLHHPVRGKYGKPATSSLTNLDLHDIARSSRTYGLGSFYAATPLADQQALAGRLLDHWVRGPGAAANPDRAEALSLVRVVPDLDAICEDIAARHGMAPTVVATTAVMPRKGVTVGFGAVRRMLGERPVLLVFGTGHGLAREVTDRADAILRPLRWLGGYNHLSVRAAAAIVIDRLLGDA